MIFMQNNGNLFLNSRNIKYLLDSSFHRIIEHQVNINIFKNESKGSVFRVIVNKDSHSIKKSAVGYIEKFSIVGNNQFSHAISIIEIRIRNM